MRAQKSGWPDIPRRTSAIVYPGRREVRQETLLPVEEIPRGSSLGYSCISQGGSPAMVALRTLFLATVDWPKGGHVTQTSQSSHLF